ncbi:MAG: PBP1A family penicillin-binding protein [Rickettsiales bacterium]|nr:PBP1A family penicillin-binding protein [Rickettsiales bacterium]
MPNHKNLKQYEPSLMTRLYSSDGKFLKGYAKEKRLFVSVQQVPDIVKYAFISAEDDTFYTNSGISIKHTIYSAFQSFFSMLTGGDKLRGGSTITQQVAKNFLLSSEKTLIRKFREILISIRLANDFSKDEILELYLNQIYFGNHSYGVVSAALNYFNKSLDELNIQEVAMLAALPKAPSQMDPTRRTDNEYLLNRRNWIIDRMKSFDYISEEEAEKATNSPIVLRKREFQYVANGEFFSEDVRKKMDSLYGNKSVMHDGYIVMTTIDPDLQKIADEYLKQGIEEYDVRHGFRGAIDNIAGEIDFQNRWGDLINKYVVKQNYRENWKKAVVLGFDKEYNNILIGIGRVSYSPEYVVDDMFVQRSGDDELLVMGYIPLENFKWARKYIDVDTIGREIRNIDDVGLTIGDIIVVEKMSNEYEYYLRQIPNINGGLVAINPHNGDILAMMGGYIDSQIDFNRVTQSQRQPGSAVKPFVYLTALENGYMPTSIIIDEEIVLAQGDKKLPYRPRNNEGDGIYFGPTTLRVGLEKSRNVTTVRLASEVGLKKVIDNIKKFDINQSPNVDYSTVLGSTETNLMKIVRAYSIIMNGGNNINTNTIDYIQDRYGKVIFRNDDRECQKCVVDDKKIPINDIIVPELKDNREKIVDPATAYQLTNMLVGVVQRGTGWRAKSLNKIIGGKTGTTNDSKDAWFIGFTPDLMVGVYVGFDSPDTLGRNEYGGNVAGIIFTNFMKEALKNKHSKPFSVPKDIKLIRIDSRTGYYPNPDTEDKDVVIEAFKVDEEPINFFDDMEKMMDEIDMNMEDYEEQPEIIINENSKKIKIDNSAEILEDDEYDVIFKNEAIFDDE